ncbi:hypothetical protein V8E54_008466 [Elaphomyces granulatus]
MYDSKECKRAGDGKDVVKGEYLLRTELEPGLRLTAEIEKISGLKIFGMERLEQKKATYVGGIYRAIKVARVYVGPWHEDSASHVREVAFGGFEEYICLPNGTEVKASVAIPLGEETAEQPIVDGKNSTDLVHVAAGNDEEWLVETGYVGGDSPVFTSPVFRQAAGWAFARCLAVLFYFCVGLVPSVAHTLSDAIERLGRYLEPSHKVARLLVVDCGSSSPDGWFSVQSSELNSQLQLPVVEVTASRADLRVEPLKVGFHVRSLLFRGQGWRLMLDHPMCPEPSNGGDDENARPDRFCLRSICGFVERRLAVDPGVS